MYEATARESKKEIESMSRMAMVECKMDFFLGEASNVASLGTEHNTTNVAQGNDATMFIGMAI